MSIKVYNSESDNYIESEGVLDGDTVILKCQTWKQDYTQSIRSVI